jgi:hypothetical protein
MSSLNRDRVAWAEYALTAFSSQTGAELGSEALHDLIADLGHYATRHRIDFLKITARAISTWADERRHPDGIGDGPRVTITVEDRRPKRARRKGGVR